MVKAMTGNTDPVQKQASKEATDWLILLKDDPDNVTLQREFQTWLETSPVNSAAWEAMQQASNAMNKARPVHTERWQPLLAELRGETVDRGAVDVPPKPVRMPHPDWSTARRHAIGFGGIAAAVCFLAVLFGPGLLLDLRADHATGTGETKTIRLSDDSTVILAPESAIAVAYTSGERHIRLLAGRAFFDVVPNAERPFKVEARAVDVTVVGTGFDVRRGEDGASVAVEEGVVRVGHATMLPSVTETLTAGQLIQVSWEGRSERSSRPVDQIAAWRRNQLIARDEPLGTVVDELRRYYAGTIIVTDAALAARPVTGVYNLDDPIAALRGISRAQNGVVRRVTPWLIFISVS